MHTILSVSFRWESMNGSIWNFNMPSRCIWSCTLRILMNIGRVVLEIPSFQDEENRITLKLRTRFVTTVLESYPAYSYYLYIIISYYSVYYDFYPTYLIIQKWDCIIMVSCAEFYRGNEAIRGRWYVLFLYEKFLSQRGIDRSVVWILLKEGNCWK